MSLMENLGITGKRVISRTRRGNSKQSLILVHNPPEADGTSTLLKPQTAESVSQPLLFKYVDMFKFYEELVRFTVQHRKVCSVIMAAWWRSSGRMDMA